MLSSVNMTVFPNWEDARSFVVLIPLCTHTACLNRPSCTFRFLYLAQYFQMLSFEKKNLSVVNYIMALKATLQVCLTSNIQQFRHLFVSRYYTARVQIARSN